MKNFIVLTVLEPKNNFFFRGRYLSIPYDMNKKLAYSRIQNEIGHAIKGGELCTVR